MNCRALANEKKNVQQLKIDCSAHTLLVRGIENSKYPVFVLICFLLFLVDITYSNEAFNASGTTSSLLLMRMDYASFTCYFGVL